MQYGRIPIKMDEVYLKTWLNINLACVQIFYLQLGGKKTFCLVNLSPVKICNLSRKLISIAPDMI